MAIPVALFFITAMGFPIKWSKCHGGTEYQWIGYWESKKLFTLGISEGRREWAVNWIQGILAKEGICVAEFRGGLGRLGFVCGALFYDRLLLGPLYTWVEACAGGCFREIPVFIKFVLKWLQDRLTSRKEIRCDRGRAREEAAVEVFRSDAKAEGDTVRLGGWQVVDAVGNKLSPGQAPW